MCGCRKFRSPRGDSRKGKVGLAKTCLAGRAALMGGSLARSCVGRGALRGAFSGRLEKKHEKSEKKIWSRSKS